MSAYNVVRNPTLATTSIYSAPRRQYQQIVQDYNPSLKALWTYMNPTGVPCFNSDMLEELHHSVHQLEKHKGMHFHENQWQPFDYCVIGSRHPKIFNLGGDLALFVELIRTRNREGLMQYGKLCIEGLYTRICGYNSSVITITMLQGDAFGGGLEFALSSNIIVAEKGSRLGFPEILFNLFPGMGAYTLLYRKVGMKITEELITSGNTYTAEDLAKMGVVDILVPQGEAEKYVFELMQKQKKHVNSSKSVYECRRHTDPIRYEEFEKIINTWVDAALRLNDQNLHIMRRLIHSQRHQQEQKLAAARNREAESQILVAA